MKHQFLTMLFVPRYEAAGGNQVSRLEWTFGEERAKVEGGVTGGFVILQPAVQPQQLVVSSLPVFGETVLDVGAGGSVTVPDAEGVLVEWWLEDVGLSVTFTNAKKVVPAVDPELPVDMVGPEIEGVKEGEEG